MNSMMLKWRYAATVFVCAVMASWSFAESVLPFADDFESYALGTPLIDGTNGWYASDTNVQVQGDVVYEGTQAAQVPLDCLLSNRFDTNATSSATNLWMEFWVQPVRYTGANDPECETNIATAFYLNSNGYFVLRDAAQWIVASNTSKGAELQPIDTDTWVQVDCMLDYSNKQWYFLQNGQMVRAQLGFVDPTVEMLSSMDVYNGSGPTTFIDKVTVSTEIPPGLTNTIPTNWGIPTLALSNEVIHVTAFPGEIGVSGSFEIHRQDGSAMAFTNTPQQIWLSVDTADGVIDGTNTSQSVQVTVDSTGFFPGVYTGYVTVAATDDLTGADAHESPQTVTVIMTVNPRASIAVSTNSVPCITREGVSVSSFLDIWNGSGHYTLDFTTTVSTDSGGDWLSVTPVSGSSTGDNDKVGFTIMCDASTVATNRGSYTGRVTFAGTMTEGGHTYEADESPTVVEVVLNVEYPAPSLGVHPTLFRPEVIQGSNAPNNIFNVWNANSNYTLVFNATADQPWVTVTPTNGTSNGEEVQVTLSYNVTNLAAGVHTAQVEVVGTDQKYGEAALDSPQFVTIQVKIVAPSAPAWISASDDAYTNRVSVQWGEVNNVIAYKVFRNVTDDAETAEEIAHVNAPTDNYSDTNAVHGKLYYYWVCSVNPYGYLSAYSVSDAGNRKLMPPTDIAATKDTHTDKVVVTWNDAPGVPAGYQVWRQEGAGASVIIGSSTNLTYNDTTAVPGTRYNYRVSATNNVSVSEQGPTDNGWRRFIAPVDMEASRGTLDNRVNVTWTAVDGATSYEVERNGALIGEVAGASYSDAAVAMGEGYNYRVRAKNILSTGEYSTAVLGWASLGAPAPIQASQGVYSYMVNIKWPAFAVAMNQYEVQRSKTDSFAQYDALGFGEAEGAGFKYDDTTAVPGTKYYYRVKGIKGAMYWMSAAAQGWRSLAAPTGVNASQGTYPGGILVKWNAVDGAVGYEVWANDEDDQFGATKKAEVAVRQYADMSVNSGAARYYWVKAKADSGALSGFSTVAHGYAPTTVIFGGPGFVPVPADYDGDGIDDLGVYKAANGHWKVRMSGFGYNVIQVQGFGGPGFLPAVGDYDGDGLADPGVYKAATGEWKVWMSSIGYNVVTVRGFGGADSVAIPSDYDGDGKCDPAVYFLKTGQIRVWMSASGYAPISAVWGGLGWLPSVGGDADGDNKADPVIYNPAKKTFKGLCSILGYAEVVMGGMGAPGYIPINRDYDGDGLVDPAAYSAATGTWKVWGSRGAAYKEKAYTIGGDGWVVAPLDYFGNGRKNLCVYKEATGMWWVRKW